MIYVLYHRNCNNGYGAAWAAYTKLGLNGVKYIDVNYNEDFPEMKPNSMVYLVDFSYKKDQLLKLAKNHEKVIVLDHHVTAQEELAGLLGTRNIEGVFNMNKSSSVITWEYFHPISEVPLLLKHIQDRDLWKFELENTKGVHEILCLIGYHSFDRWDEIASKLQENPKEIYQQGNSIVKKTNVTVDMICNFGHVINTPFGKCAIVNCTAFWSEVGNELLKKFPEAEFSASYYKYKDIGWKWSLRSNGDFDVSGIAKTFNGGGHKNTAGFKTEELIWL